MEIKKYNSGKTTDQSSNQSSLSEKIAYKPEPQKNVCQNIQNNEKKTDIKHVNAIRKYTMEPQIFRKEFVPVIRPIEIHLVPSKLRLNEIEFKHFKKNKNNKDLSLSCPCSEDESEGNEYSNLSDSSDMSDISDFSNHINNMENELKNIRKNFIKLKNGSIHKVMTKTNFKNKQLSKQFDCFDNSDFEEEKNKIKEEIKDDDSFSSDLYDDYNFTNYTMKPYDNKDLKLKFAKSSEIVNDKIKGYENIINNEKFRSNNNNDANNNNLNHNKRNRIYSFTILDTLKNKLKIDK